MRCDPGVSPWLGPVIGLGATNRIVDDTCQLTLLAAVIFLLPPFSILARTDLKLHCYIATHTNLQ